MANYSIVINSRFKPFSYQELLAPALMSTQAHQQVEEAYANLASEAAIAGNKANEQTDPVAYARYKAYSDDLNAMATELAKNGLTPNSRKSMFDMRTRYAKDIVPIETAYERRRALAEEQRKMQLTANGNLRFDNDFSTLSLDALLNNPEMSYNALNGENITARASALAANFARGIVNDPKYTSILNGQYWQAKQQAGYTPEQIIMEAAGDPNAPAELRQIRENIHKQLQGNSAYDRDWVDSYISQGFTSGIGQAQYSTMGDQSYMNAAQKQAMQFSAEEHKWAEEDRKEAKETRYITDEKGNILPIDTKTGIPYEVKDGKKVLKPSAAAAASSSKNTSSSNGGKTGSENNTRSKTPIKITIQGKRNKKGVIQYGGETGRAVPIKDVETVNSELETATTSRLKSYYELGPTMQKNVEAIHGISNPTDYDYYEATTENDEVVLYVIPRGNVKPTAEGYDSDQEGYTAVDDNAH